MNTPVNAVGTSAGDVSNTGNIAASGANTMTLNPR